MKINIPYLKYLIFLLAFILTSCDFNNTDDVEVASSYNATAVLSQENTSTILITETHTFTYMPQECKNIYWEYENALLNVDFSTIRFEQNVEYSEQDFPFDFPYSIYSDLKTKLINDLNGIHSTEGVFNEWAYLSSIDYYLFDLNDDGTKDYLAKGILGIKSGYSAGGSGQYVSSVYLLNSGKNITPIDCRLDNTVSILKTKTNGLYDILTGYLGNDICRYDGQGSYDIPFKSRYSRLSSATSLDNGIVRFEISLFDFHSELDEYYIAAYFDDERLKERVIYSCDELGNAIIYPNEKSNTGVFTFYAEYIDTTADFHGVEPNIVQIKIVPVRGGN